LAVAAEVIAGVLVALLLLAAALAFLVGIAGVFAEGIERCPRGGP
jgi:hypothetical protein